MKCKLVVIGFLCALYSCKDKKAEWLKRYAKIKCAYQTEKGRITQDSSNRISSLIREKETIQKQLVSTCSPYEQKLKELNTKIKETEKKYRKKSREVQDEQSSKYGHVSTPAYEKKLQTLEDWRLSELSPLQKQVEQLIAEMKKSPGYLLNQDKLKKQEERINTVYNSIIEAYKPGIDSLQEMLNLENNNYTYLNRELTTEEQKLLKQKRDSIRLNPCR